MLIYPALLVRLLRIAGSPDGCGVSGVWGGFFFKICPHGLAVRFQTLK